MKISSKLLRTNESYHVTTNTLKCRPSTGYNMLITCEHGGKELPPGRPWHAQDLRLRDTHWSCDLGTHELSTELSSRMRVPAIIHNQSRLIIDVNRPLDSPTLFREVADGIKIELNQSITATERQRRIDRFYKPYHDEMAYLSHILNPSLALSIHSFTDNYEGQRREIEVGVLFKESESLAIEFETLFRNAGYNVRLNEPWSGKEGYMYAASQIETEENKAIMLEFRQDLLLKDVWRNKLIGDLENILKSLTNLRHTAITSKPVEIGDQLQNFTFLTLKDDKPTPIHSSELFKNKKVVLFGVPGPYTPGCTNTHLPSFIQNYQKLKSKGVDIVACTSVSDAFVMDNWNKTNGGKDKITMLADGNGDFVNMLGLTQNMYNSGMGVRGKRFAMILVDGKVKWVGVDPKGVNLSKAESVLEKLD